MICPVEKIIADALKRAGIPYLTGDHPGNAAWLDFYLPEQDIYIEVKQFHSERIAGQTARAPNVIVIQGAKAAEWFASVLTKETLIDALTENGNDSGRTDRKVAGVPAGDNRVD